MWSDVRSGVGWCSDVQSRAGRWSDSMERPCSVGQEGLAGSSSQVGSHLPCIPQVVGHGVVPVLLCLNIAYVS